MKVVGVVCLLETKVEAPNLGVIYQRLFVRWCFTSKLVAHKGGRILLTWIPNSFHVNIIKVTGQVIHCVIADRIGGNPPFGVLSSMLLIVLLLT